MAMAAIVNPVDWFIVASVAGGILLVVMAIGFVLWAGWEAEDSEN